MRNGKNKAKLILFFHHMKGNNTHTHTMSIFLSS